MRKKKSIGLWAGICLLLLGLVGNVNVFAAVAEEKAGETLTGEYAVIINTDTSNSRSAGTLVFDDSGNMASYSGGNALPAAQSLAELGTTSVEATSLSPERTLIDKSDSNCSCTN